MIYSIFRNNLLIASVTPLDSSELSQKKQSDDIIRLVFVLEVFVELKICDYISFAKTNQIYYLNKKPRVITSPKKHTYECIFEGGIHELKKTKAILTTGDYVDYKYPITGNSGTFLNFIVDNLNRNSSGYTVGNYTDTDIFTIDFNNWNVFEAITEISKVLNISWYLDGKTLHFTEKQVSTPCVFQVGRLSGFTQLTRTRVQSTDIQTIVYGYGSPKNLPPRVADSGQVYDSELLTENRLSFEGIDGHSKLEKNVGLYGKIETVQEFEIQPERTGTVTNIVSDSILEFFDTTIDFDIEAQKLSGIKPKITFVDGLLIGLTFNITYEHTTKKITMDYFSDESGQYPNNTIKVSVNDSYKLLDIIMPESYISDARARLKQATQDYIDEKSTNLELFEGQIDEGYIRENNISLDLGDFIRVISSEFKIDNLYEIKELTQNITNPNKYVVKFGDVLPQNLISLLKNATFATQQSIYSVQKTTYTTNKANNQTTNIVNEGTEWQSL